MRVKKEKVDKKKYDVIGLGHALVDVLAHVSDDFITDHGLKKGTVTLANKSTVKRFCSLVKINSHRFSGGIVANTMAGIASFGGKSSFIGNIKQDQLGDIFSVSMQLNNVHFSQNTPTFSEKMKGFITGSNKSTGFSCVLVTPDRKRTIITYLGAAANIKEEDVNDALLSDTKIIMVEAYLWDSNKELVKKAAEIAEKNNVKLALTLSDPFCVTRHRKDLHDFVRYHTDILFAQESEILSLFEVNNIDEAITAIKHQCEISVITRSDLGSIVVKGDEQFKVRSISLGITKDTTGAGDYYASGFLYGYINNFSLQKSGELGRLAAGEVITHDGARSEMDLSELIEDVKRKDI